MIDNDFFESNKCLLYKGSLVFVAFSLFFLEKIQENQRFLRCVSGPAGLGKDGSGKGALSASDIF